MFRNTCRSQVKMSVIKIHETEEVGVGTLKMNLRKFLRATLNNIALEFKKVKSEIPIHEILVSINYFQNVVIDPSKMFA